MGDTQTDWVAVNKAEACDFVRSFYRASWDWRALSYHAKWDRWERNARNIYDPAIAALKEDWQSTMFIPVTVSNIEVITSALHKILLGRKRPIGFEPREMGDDLQAELHSNLLDHQIDRSNFPLTFNDLLKEAATFGSAFAKYIWERRADARRLRQPRRAVAAEAVAGAISPGDIVGYDQVTQKVMVREGVRVEKVHIRDIFLEPNSTTLRQVLHRGKLSYGELKQNVANGFDKQSVDELWGHFENENFEMDVAPLKYDQEISDNPKLPRPSYAKRHTVWEYWGEVPRRWLELSLPWGQPEGEELVPGKLMVGSGNWFLASEENPNPDMEPPFGQLDYLRNLNETYGIGVAQLMEGLQEEINEIRNLRVDNVNLVLNKIFAVVEKKLVDPKEVVSKPGGVIRLKGEIDDVRRVVSEIPISDVAISAFRETAEIERQIQETTGANRVTVGTAGQTRDSNQTLGGMELLRQSAADRFTVTAYNMGCAFLKPAAMKIMGLIYQNMGDEQMRRVLGNMPVEMLNFETGEKEIVAKWRAFKWLAPHELDEMYDVVPFDVFSEENKFAKSQNLGSFIQLLATVVPQYDPRPALERMAELQGMTADEVQIILSGLTGPVASPMMMGKGVPSLASASNQKTALAPSPAGPALGMPGGPQMPH